MGLVFNLVFTNEDNDGQPVGGGPAYQQPQQGPAKITGEQLKSLRLKLRLLEMNGQKDVEAKMCHWLGIATISDCPAEWFAKTLHALDRKLAAANIVEAE